jgi:L-threonylcarbamoyladenylate synthase
MIVRRSLKAVDQVTGGQLAVGLRMPGHPLALALLEEFGEGVAAPSANKFGHVSPTVAKDVEEEFAREVSLVLDGGACRVGIESTIVDLSGDYLKILRPGMIMESQIAQALRRAGAKLQEGLLAEGLAPSSQTGQQQLRVPGALPKHYAPKTPMVLVPSSFLAAKIAEIGNLQSIVVLAFAKPGANNILPGDWIVAESDPSLYAQRIYANLRAIDRLKKDLIIVEEPPDAPEWTGIRDRLRRASSPA